MDATGAKNETSAPPRAVVVSIEPANHEPSRDTTYHAGDPPTAVMDSEFIHNDEWSLYPLP
jgi:hypothetical protein